MNDYLSKNNPGCYHSMLEYLSQKSGLSAKKDIIINKQEQLKQGKRMKYKSYDITVVDTMNLRHQYIENNMRYDQRGIDAKHFIVRINRPLEDFKEIGINIEPAGAYKDSLGGGWHQSVAMFKVNDKYFALMDCAC